MQRKHKNIENTNMKLLQGLGHLVLVGLLLGSCVSAIPKDSTGKDSMRVDSLSYSEKIQSEVILDTTTTEADEDIAYPEGQPRIVSVKIIVPVGVETGWHTHGAPIYAYIVSGTLEVEYGETKVKKQFKAGDALVDALNVAHNGKAIGEKPAELIVVFSSSEGTELTIPYSP